MYKRFIKRKGKVYGPYTYHSIRDKDGKVKNIYIASSKQAASKTGDIKASKEKVPKETKPKKFNFLRKLKPKGGYQGDK